MFQSPDLPKWEMDAQLIRPTAQLSLVSEGREFDFQLSQANDL